MTVASGKSVYLAKKQADETLGATDFVAPATVYLALFTVAPVNGVDTGATEASGGSYARKSIANDGTHWSAATGTTTPCAKVNAGTITMFTASADVSTAANIVAWGLYDASTSGNLLYYGPVGTPQPVLSGQTPTFAAGAIAIALQ